MASYIYRATGTVAVNSTGAVLAPGSPTGATIGDRLIGVTWQRSASTATEANWTKIGSIVGSQALEVWSRIADGTAADAFAPDWAGTSECGAFVEAWYGDVYADTATLVAHTASASTGGSANLTLPPLTGGSTTDCMVYCVSRKNNTATDATTISHASLTVRTQVVSTSAGRSHVATGTLQQTSYADFDGTDFTVNGTAESLTSNGIVLYLETTADISGGLVLPTMYRKPNVLLRM